MKRKLKNLSKQVDIKSLIIERLVEVNLNTTSVDARKKEDIIFDKILKDIPVDNDTFHIEHVRENSAFSLKEDKEQFEKEQLLREIEDVDNELKRIMGRDNKSAS